MTTSNCHAAADVIVVGAGLSGLTAAYTILRHQPKTKVLILEATDRIGGNLSSWQLKTADGTREWDMCGPRIGSSQKEILSLVRELDLETYPQYNKGNKFWRLPDGKVKKFSGAIPPLPYIVLLDLVRYFKKVDSMQGQLKFDRILECEHVEEWDGQTVEEFSQKYLWTQVSRTTIETMTRSFCGYPGAELTMMQYLYIIHTSGNWDLHINSGDKGRMDLNIKGGISGVCRKLSKKVGMENIVLGESVTEIREAKDSDGCTQVTVTTATTQREYHAQHVVVALPCNVTDNIQFQPPLETNRSCTFPLQMNMLVCVLTYKSAFWREAGHTGEYMNMTATVSSRQSASGEPIIISFDSSLPSGEPALIVVANLTVLKGKSMEERRDIITHDLSEIFGLQILDCLDYQEKEYLHGSTTDDKMTQVSRSSALLASLTKQHGRVHWAGADSATSWANTINGAVQSGQRAGQEVMAEL